MTDRLKAWCHWKRKYLHEKKLNHILNQEIRALKRLHEQTVALWDRLHDVIRSVHYRFNDICKEQYDIETELLIKKQRLREQEDPEQK